MRDKGQFAKGVGSLLLPCKLQSKLRGKCLDLLRHLTASSYLFIYCTGLPTEPKLAAHFFPDLFASTVLGRGWGVGTRHRTGHRHVHGEGERQACADGASALGLALSAVLIFFSQLVGQIWGRILPLS